MMKKNRPAYFLLTAFAAAMVLGFALPALAAEAGHHGVNWKDYIYRIINFIVLVILLIKFLRKPLNEFLEKRHFKVKEELRKARELSEAAEKIFQEAQRRLASMDEEIQAIREQMLKEVEKEKQRLLKEAERKAAVMKAQAEQELMEEIAQLKRKLREEISLEALALAEKLIQKSITRDDQKKLIDGYIHQLGSRN